MRESVRALKPHIHITAKGERYASLEIGKLTRLERSGYKLEGSIFATSDINRATIHRVLDELMDRLDQEV